MINHTASINQRRLAKELDIHHVYLNAILRGRARPSPDLALLIDIATKGAVTKEKLLWPDLQP